MRGTAMVVLATVIMSLAVAQAAWAVGGTVTIHFDHAPEVFHGKVQSPSAECRVGRVVKLFKVTSDGREAQGKVRTNDAGIWKLELMHAEGSYIAIAPKFKGMHATCDRLASSTLDVM